MIYDDGTMDVYIDGKLERRRYSHTERSLDWMPNPMNGLRPSLDYPELLDGEQAVFVLTEDIPRIIKVRR